MRSKQISRHFRNCAEFSDVEKLIEDNWVGFITMNEILKNIKRIKFSPD